MVSAGPLRACGADLKPVLPEEVWLVSSDFKLKKGLPLTEEKRQLSCGLFGRETLPILGGEYFKDNHPLLLRHKEDAV